MTCDYAAITTLIVATSAFWCFAGWLTLRDKDRLIAALQKRVDFLEGVRR